jgi:class 3 adenylate cyclase
MAAGPPMQQILDWLEALGLGQYAQRFAENDIDVDILSDLTDQDLKEIGVASLGHRRKLLRAITNLKGVEQTSAVVVEATPPSTRAADAAERRQVTVMFSDLVGSTALSARMDPEDLREVISAYQRCVTVIIRRFGGFVANYMGDGVLAYFGYPEAHEDDAERAVRAGLELIAAVIALKTPVSMQTRVGIATGLVVVGNLVGVGERGIVGETPNLAARLQGIAGPNRALPNVRLDIVERTDGIPLFIEEMTKAVLEAESEGDARRTVASAPALTLAVPASLQASLMARLDRLGPTKEVAQIGAVIGRKFSHALLAAAASKPQAELASALDHLFSRVCYSGKACRHTRAISSSTLLCRTRPTARCCASLVGRCTLASPMFWKISFQRSPRASRSC